MTRLRVSRTENSEIASWREAFTLIEVLVALALGASMAILVGSGLIQSLKMEASGLRKSEASLLIKTVECAQTKGAGSESVQDKNADWAIIADELELNERDWKVWQISPQDRRSSSWSLFFIDPD